MRWMFPKFYDSRYLIYNIENSVYNIENDSFRSYIKYGLLES